MTANGVWPQRTKTTLRERENEREGGRELGGKAGFSKPLQTLSGLNYCTCWALKTTSHRDGHTTPEADVNLQCTLGLLKDACCIRKVYLWHLPTGTNWIMLNSCLIWTCQNTYNSQYIKRKMYKILWNTAYCFTILNKYYIIFIINI